MASGNGNLRKKLSRFVKKNKKKIKMKSFAEKYKQQKQ